MDSITLSLMRLKLSYKDINILKKEIEYFNASLELKDLEINYLKSRLENNADINNLELEVLKSQLKIKEAELIYEKSKRKNKFTGYLIGFVAGAITFTLL